MNIAGINLRQVAADAEQLSARHEIPLKWT